MTENTAAIETVEDVTELETETVEELTLEEFVDGVVGTLPEIVTPYGIFKVLKAVGRFLESDRVFVPQMMYNYARNGMIAGKDSKGRKEYTHEETVAFVLKYVTKNLIK